VRRISQLNHEDAKDTKGKEIEPQRARKEIISMWQSCPKGCRIIE
jgi:hypothetical protein